MSEQEIREGMLLAVWDEPPLDFDPDKLIRRVEQKKSRRRALVAVGVATAMIVVTSLALPGLLPRDQDGQLASEVPPPSTSAPPSVSPEKKGQRIGDRLAEKLGLRMTNFKEVYASFRAGAYAYNPNSQTTPPQRPWDPELSGLVHFTDEIGPTSLRVILTKDRTVAEQICSGATTCREVAQSDGTTVTESTVVQGSEIARSTALRKFPSGYYAEISSFNYNPATSDGLRKTAPVPVEVLTTLVTDPDVHWE
ncbi:hypothetical protein ACFOWZ_13070 [Lentzea rhizosphaerae]|uniref:Uncharacterized protein n=1 Tax=Lentzea rhizosphaerae TaxID=2041025 RepID=A0ABV8BPX6_9PSEU